MSKKRCDAPAFVRYTWPGRDESFACATHALQIQGIAHALGLYLQIIPLTFEEMLENKICSQIISDGGNDVQPNGPN
jgi:hypothetical protein